MSTDINALVEQFKEWSTTPIQSETWASFIRSVPEDQHIHLVVLGGFALMMLTHYIYGGFLFIVDVYHVPDFVQKNRIQKNRPYKPGGSPHNPSIYKTLRQVLFNQIFVVIPGLYFMQWGLPKLGLPWAAGVQVKETLPSPRDFAVHALLGTMLVEVFFFTSHWILHQKPFYAYIHKVHHEFKTPHAFAAIYAHPLEALFGNTFAVMGPAFLCGFNLFGWYLGVVLGWISTCSGHSGYIVPQFNKDGAHDWHHSEFRDNYGTLGILDYIFGTSHRFLAHRRKLLAKQRLEKQS